MSPNYGGRSQMSFLSMIPPAIRTIIVINVIIFLLQIGIFPNIQLGGLSFNALFVKYSALWQPDSGYFYPWQFITYQFMHGGWGHIFFNMYGLWILGSEVENLWGSKRFTWFYLLSGIGGGLTHLLVNYVTNSTNPYGDVSFVPTVGASGSIFGVMLAFGMLFPERSLIVFPLFIPIRARIFVAIYIGLNLLQGLTGSESDVAHFAHLGGALTGYLLIKFGDKLGIFELLNKFTGMFGNNTASHGRSRVTEAKFKERSFTVQPQTTERKAIFHGGTFYHNGEQITTDVVDSILDKINVVGFDNLSDREKEILKEVSRRMS